MPQDGFEEPRETDEGQYGGSRWKGMLDCGLFPQQVGGPGMPVCGLFPQQVAGPTAPVIRDRGNGRWLEGFHDKIEISGCNFSQSNFKREFSPRSDWPGNMKNEKAAKCERPAEEEKIISAWEAANIDISEKCIEILAGERIRPEKVSRIDRLFELVPTIPVGDRPSLMDHFPNLIPGAPVAAARSNGQSPWIACVVGYPRIM
ncbi:hypothetical protein PAPYR_12674 [Paratrimastix pyriformis]|uniref:Uncharacterized protein n=1 Tax=Paratrimastix pyriformis TaxID=342808 RepID=A0ABQ8U6R5_9EUKA|nr:hypothetical protein PAPYR_12674 [Paratrimastix pyriformis]